MDFRKVLLCAGLSCLLVSCGGKGTLRPSPLTADVVQCRLVSNGDFVGIRLRVTGFERFDHDAMESYLLDESTGEKFSVVHLQRIGRLAEFPVLGEKDVRTILYRNREGKLKVGTIVTLVVGSARVENILLQE